MHIGSCWRFDSLTEVMGVVVVSDHCACHLLHSPKKMLENGSKRSTMELEYWEKEVKEDELVSQ